MHIIDFRECDGRIAASCHYNHPALKGLKIGFSLTKNKQQLFVENVHRLLTNNATSLQAWLISKRIETDNVSQKNQSDVQKDNLKNMPREKEYFFAISWLLAFWNASLNYRICFDLITQNFLYTCASAHGITNFKDLHTPFTLRHIKQEEMKHLFLEQQRASADKDYKPRRFDLINAYMKLAKGPIINHLISEAYAIHNEVVEESKLKKKRSVNQETHHGDMNKKDIIASLLRKNIYRKFSAH